ncbi:MAG: hypothetical protein PVI33_01215 [Candidatus Omnitrophota bacterium]|jgi:hypothetical protein
MSPHPRKSLNLLSFFIILSILVLPPAFTQEGTGESELAGEFFGIPVSLGNYYFAKRVVLTFDAQWRGVPQDAEELEDLTWQELLFSYEAFRRGIQVTNEEKEAEIDKIMQAEKAEFNWKEDKKEYAKWVEDKIKGPVDLFENQIEHLLRIEKLRQQVLGSIEPEATKKEAYDKFLDEYNSLGVELIQFEDSQLQEAEKLYRQAKSDPEAWEEKKQEKPEAFKNLSGPYALDFLINLWGFQREDAYKMIKMKPGQFYKPFPIYKGYAVLKIISTRKADPEKFDERKEQYFDKVKNIKKYQGFKDWAAGLKKQANIKVFIKPTTEQAESEENESSE